MLIVRKDGNVEHFDVDPHFYIHASKHMFLAYWSAPGKDCLLHSATCKTKGGEFAYENYILWVYVQDSKSGIESKLFLFLNDT